MGDLDFAQSYFDKLKPMYQHLSEKQQDEVNTHLWYIENKLLVN